MRVLVFGTCYCGDESKLRLLEQWAEALRRVAPGFDHLVVDSNSPVFDTASLPLLSGFGPRGFISSEPGLLAPGHRSIVSFPDNVGHLSAGGRDGWGRAFCQGLLAGMAGGYDYVIHVEGDLLTRLDLPAICRDMAARRIEALAAITPGKGWLETGLVLLSVGLVRRLRLVKRYDWSRRSLLPYPEILLGELLGDAVLLRLWRGSKDDVALARYRIRHLDWLTKPRQPGTHEAFLSSGDWPSSGGGDPAVLDGLPPTTGQRQ
ncbi:MAG: hypothetical protein U1E53_16520 [Dongiaceae bacterium]